MHLCWTLISICGDISVCTYKNVIWYLAQQLKRSMYPSGLYCC